MIQRPIAHALLLASSVLRSHATFVDVYEEKSLLLTSWLINEDRADGEGEQVSEIERS